MVGSWNMLVYGTGFYLMEKISGNTRVSRSPKTFFFYFLGLTNLMFNWGHHIYNVPNAAWIRQTAYVISMTELPIIGNIIYNWRKTLSDAKRNYHLLPYRFLSAADIWIFLNLCLAVLISVPAINQYTHGTHITVAHAMGATIGINTMLLFASLYFISEKSHPDIIHDKRSLTSAGFWITNFSLLLFWISLIGSGIIKAVEKESGLAFQQIMSKLSPWFHAFAGAGLFLFLGICMLAYPLFLSFSKK
jgi:nitric oxide reductase subunit B